MTVNDSSAETDQTAFGTALERYHIEQRFELIETIVAGDWTFERGIESMTITPITGGDAQNMSQRALLILRRAPDGRWRFARGMTNNLPPASSS